MSGKNVQKLRNNAPKIKATWSTLISGLLFIGILCSTIFGVTFVDNHGQLKVSGNKIVDKNDKPITLHGMSMYCWAQQGLQYYNAATIKKLVDEWKCTVIRVPILPYRVASMTNQVKRIVDACIENGIYVIIDWHAMAGADSNTTAVCNFFKSMATDYGNKPNVMYEPWNEPVRESWTQIKTYHEKVIAAIRSVDPDNIIICGNQQYDQRPDLAANDPIKSSTNIAYSVHFYAATHGSSFRTNAQNALTKGVALFATEYGTCESNGSGSISESETRAWWTFLDDNGIGCSNWSVAALEETSAILPLGAPLTGWTDANLKPSGKLVKAYIISKFQGIGVINFKSTPDKHVQNTQFTITSDPQSSIYTLQGTQVNGNSVKRAANGIYTVKDKRNSKAQSVGIVR